jgi:hypothetical protein
LHPSQLLARVRLLSPDSCTMLAERIFVRSTVIVSHPV